MARLFFLSLNCVKAPKETQIFEYKEPVTSKTPHTDWTRCRDSSRSDFHPRVVPTRARTDPDVCERGSSWHLERSRRSVRRSAIDSRTPDVAADATSPRKTSVVKQSK